jgi:NHLM bacteriocin system ABC transporter ATP-binding protein
MSEPLLSRTGAVPAGEPVAVQAIQTVRLDGRRPKLLDHHDHVLQVTAGHVDLFAVSVTDGKAATTRQHLFRVESGEIIADLFNPADPSGSHLQVIAVGGAGAEALMVRRAEFDDNALVEAWIARLSKMIAGPHPSWEISEASNLVEVEMKPGERRRGPARSVVWVSVRAGGALLMGHEPAYLPGSPPAPLAAGSWIVAAPNACTLANGGRPSAAALWAALDHFHRCAMECIHEWSKDNAADQRQLLFRRTELTNSQALDLFDRLSAIVVPRSGPLEADADLADPLLAAFRVVGKVIQMPIVRPSGRSPAQQGFADVVDIARASRVRVRRILLRADWWNKDAGPMLAWHGEARDPVALVRVSGHYAMIETKTATRRRVDRRLAMELYPEAATFYPTLPSSPVKLRDLLSFSFRHARGNVARIALTVVMLGSLSLVVPLIVQALVNSVIPRTEIDQLAFCALALAVTATAMAGVQLVESTAMLRLDSMIDWRLQAAVIDRVLRLPAGLFREYTVGDFVGRALGIDAIRRIFTGQTLRSLMAGLFCWFSILLMVIYDPGLALIALALTFFRALLIVGASALRVYHETRQFNLQGKTEGLVLQLFAGVGKLRVAAATVRALAVWSRLFAAQKRHFIASQRAANALALFEISFPTFATLILFACAAAGGSKLTLNLGAFLAFFTAFGQLMAGIGMWAAGVSSSLIAIPHITRLRPLITAAAEISDDRKPPGQLTGAVELSRITFRYEPGGPAVVDNVSLRVAPGEYVAIVGPSGSGKSSLFRLLLGFERPESGAVFFDGKALDTLDISAVRRQLGVVLQNGKLATGSLYENICGGLQLPLEQAWDAARMAGLDADIKAMPMGMHTAIAEGVNSLSGGQRQRVMIARAVARRPRILLFDEATSSLDNRSQAIVSDALGALNVTRIVIAHRLSTVRDADRIAVIVDGKLVQTGTFAELSAAKGVFADFARRQLL